MGLSERVGKALLRPIRRWLREDFEVEMRWSWSRLELRLGMLELNPELMNVEALSSTPVILQRATLECVRIGVSLVNAPALTLLFEGLHVELVARNPEDPYWKKTVVRQRIETLASIDPEGASEHVRAKRLEEGDDRSNGFLGRLIVRFLLSALRVEFLRATVTLHSQRSNAVSLTASRLIAAERTENSLFQGSLVGSLGNMIHTAKGGSTKQCSASQLQLDVRTHGKTRWGRIDEASNDSSQHAVLVVMLWFCCSFHDASFHGVSFRIPEIVSGLETDELHVIMEMIAELEGPSLGCDLRSGTAASGSRSGKELWSWAVSRITSTPGRRLTQALKGGVLRRRYSSLYGDWLQKVGWRTKTSSLKRTSSLAKLSASVSELEKQLPVEAVALARFLARRRRLAMISKEFEDEPSKKSVTLLKKMQRYVRKITRRENADAVEVRHSGSESEVFWVDIHRGSFALANFDGATGIAICVKWKQASVAYYLKGDGIEKACVLGSMQGEILALGGDSVAVTIEEVGECSVRWADKVCHKFRVFSSLSFETSEWSFIRDHNVGLHSKHAALRNEATERWSLNSWDTAGGFNKLVERPSFVAVSETRSPDNGEERNYTSGLMLAVGRIDIHLKSVTLSEITPLLLQLQVLTKDSEESSGSHSITTVSSTLAASYQQQFSSWRDTTFGVVPDTRIHCSVVVEGISLSLEEDMRMQQHLNTLVLAFSRSELAFWPAKGHEGERPKWIRQPPVLEQPVQKGYLERDEFENNFVAFVAGVKLTNSSESLVGPFDISLESSMCRIRRSSLFDTSEAVSLAVELAVPAVIMELEVNRAAAAVKILSHYMNSAMYVYSELYASSSSRPSEAAPPPSRRVFSLDVSATFARVEIVTGALESRGKASWKNFWLTCIMGDNSRAAICSGFETMKVSLDSTYRFLVKHLIITFDGPEVTSATNDDDFHCSMKMDAGLVFVTCCSLESILAKVKRYPSISDSIRALVSVEKGGRECAVALEGGLAIFETTAMGEIIIFIVNYVEQISENIKPILLQDEPKIQSHDFTDLVRSYSLPEGPRPNTALLRTHSTPNVLSEREGVSREGVISCKIVGFSLVLAISSTGEVEGVLFAFSASSNITADKLTRKVTANLTQLTVNSLRSELNDRPHESRSRMPQFGLCAEGESSRRSESASEGRSSSVIMRTSDLSCILDCLTASLSVTRQLTKGLESKWADPWQGQLSVAGLDIALTTHELQLLFDIASSLSRISLGKDTQNTFVSIGQNAGKFAREGIPDGAIVALKDAQEHLFLCVEDNGAVKNQFHLGGAWHYSIAGERALFKVKYHDKSRDRCWFSLLSLYANDSSGSPLRVRFRPGSKQLEISSASDNSWELWQCLPFRTAGDDEVDIHTNIFSRSVHLINQKSKQGLAINDGIPTVAGYPGNPFKVKIVAEPTLQETSSSKSAVNAATSIPQVRFDLGSACVTLLHEASRVHLLPLVRVRLDEVQGLLQASSCKARTIGGCTFAVEHYEVQTGSWMPIVHPVMTEIIFCFRMGEPAHNHRKFPISLFCRLKKVETVVSELSLDACLFLIGVMNLAGPYTIKHSPVLVNRCQIENQTGLNVLFRFDRGGGGQEEGKVFAGQTSSYLIRHVRSRRGTTPAEVSTSVAICLEKPGIGVSSIVPLSLGEPGVFAGRTRLDSVEGSRVNAPGPIVVVDISKQSQDGVFLTVSPMVKIHNATGLVLQLRCRRPKQGEGGAVVTLKDGDIIDDSMGAFDALNLEGEMKKALLSFNVGNFLLSIRPEDKDGATFDWSEDVKGAKAVRVSGLFEKLHYGFKKTLKSKSLESSFGSVFCKSCSVSGSGNDTAAGLHFLIRTLRRQVPVTKLSGDQHNRRTVVAWQEQQELLLLPMLKLSNFLTATVQVRITSPSGAKSDSGGESVAVPGRGGKVSLYADLNALFLIIRVDEYGFTSQPIDVSTGQRQFQELAKKGGSIKDLDIEVDFQEAGYTASLKVYRSEDGVLQLVIYTKYKLLNDSQVPILCCVAKAPSRWQGRRVQNLQWPASTSAISLLPNSSVSWLAKSNKILMKREEEGARPSWLDLDSLSGSSELSLAVQTTYSLDKIQLGIQVQVPCQAGSDPSHLLKLASRYTVLNKSSQEILVCQDGLEEDENEYITIKPGDSAAVHAQQLDVIAESKDKDSDSSLSLRFRLKETGWRWSGRICAASLGSFFLKLRRNVEKEGSKMQLAVLHVEEQIPSLMITFYLHTREAVPYRIENRLHTASITYHQKGTTDQETLLVNASTDYVWDDLSLPHRLIVAITGSQACSEINLDKVKGWKSFASSHRSKGFSLQMPFQAQLSDGEQPDDVLDVGYEVFADGPTRICRVCQKVDSTKKSYWDSELSTPRCKVEFKIPIIKLHLVETSKQRIEDLTGEELAGASPFTPFLSFVLALSCIDVYVTSDNAICQLRVQSFGADIRWQGAPFAAMLRLHDQDRLSSSTTALHAAFVLSNFTANPIQVKYASILVQALDLNLDEDTLMKLVPFYRTSLSTTSSSLQLYFERFEIHPIKIAASFVPGHPRADYTSAQETFRALLHTVIKLPSVRGATVELNGLLLSHALLTFRQLMMKCVQHYSWYAMRAIYIARGSKLLPPGFSSLFDDSAASSLDVFFDPSSGSIDLQGLTLGMFNLLSRGLRKRDQGGTSRYLGDLEKTVKKAGSNLVFAVVTEISDNVLKGAETNGFDGMVNGFRRGVLNVAMEPLVLQKAVIRGGSTRRIQLDRSVGTDEAYIEGYLQAMLDALFKQDYLKVKVMEDQVTLKNLPPNSMLLNEIVVCVKNFLISEGLLAGEASIAATRSMRLLRGESERKVVPAIISLSEQLLVIFAIRGLRQYTRQFFHFQVPTKPEAERAGEANKAVVEQPPQLPRPSFKRTLGNFFLSSAMAYIDGRLCRHIPNELARRIVSGFLLSFVEQ